MQLIHPSRSGLVWGLLGPLLLAACGGAPQTQATPPAPTGETRQVQLRGKSVEVQVVDGLAVVEGDMIVGRITDLEPGGLGAQGIFRDAPNEYRWAGGVVPFAFEASVTASGREHALTAMRTWEAATSVRFVQNAAATDRVVFRAGTSPSWCFSDIGRQGGPQQVLLTSSGDCATTTLTHELGHTLGLFHEQTREDRGQHIQVNYANMTDAGCISAFTEQNISNGLDVGAYDLNSIMHYDRFGCSSNGKAVYETIPAGLPAGGGSRISAGDVAAINWLYLNRWTVSDGGAAPWHSYAGGDQKAADLLTGDFNGDGRTDLFLADPVGCVWYVAYSQGAVSAPWQVLSAGKCESQSVLRLGDFDGDRRTDVFVTSGGTWYVSKGGVDWWTELNTSSMRLADLAFGDFDGDGRTDVLNATGRVWRVSWGGASGWEVVNTSGYRVPQLAFHDFDGDRRTDVFRATNGVWWLSSGASGGWAELNTSGYGLSALKFGDFDGDRRTDIYRPNGAGYLVSFGGGSGSWTALPDQFKLPPRTELSGFLFGDFGGDGRPDVFATLK